MQGVVAALGVRKYDLSSMTSVVAGIARPDFYAARILRGAWLPRK